MLLCAFVFFCSAKSNSSETETRGPYYVTASASEGGFISPSGTQSYEYLSEASFTITPEADNSINEISIDGGKPFPASYFSSGETILNNNSKNIGLAVVNGQRYLLENLWLHTPISIYEANSSWMPTSKIAMSSHAVGDFYVPTISKTVNESSLFPNCIIAVGTQNGQGFVGLYNITVNSWTWINIASISYITNILNPSGTDLIIQIADVDDHGFYRTSKDDLFNYNAWKFVDLPATQTAYIENDHLDTRVACFNGFVFTLSINAHYHNLHNSFSWCVYKYSLADSTWTSMDPILYNIDDTLPRSDSLYGMVWADSSKLFLVVPFSNGTWSIYYSSDGSAFNVISSVASVNNFQGYLIQPHGEYAWASTFDGDSDYILFETQTAHDNKGYLAILDLNGTVIYKQTGFTTHFEQATQWIEESSPAGKVFWMGSTCDISPYPAVIRKLTIEYHSKEPFTFSFDNIDANHTINVTFNTPTTPTPTPSPSETQFLIDSNSTISALSFNATTPEISFTVNGTSGTTGYINATISKNLMPNGENIKINLDGNPYNYTITSNQDWWIITFTYQHSIHQIKIYQTHDISSTADSSIYLPYILAAVFVALLGFLVLIIWSTRQPAVPSRKR